VPSLAELEGARQQSGFDLTTDVPGEWSGNPATLGSPNKWWTIKDDGTLAQTDDTDAGTQYRCVFTPSG
jgi:hypothetical protein